VHVLDVNTIFAECTGPGVCLCALPQCHVPRCALTSRFASLLR